MMIILNYDEVTFSGSSVLGFTLHPSVDFDEVKQGSSFLPTTNTCIYTMQLPRPYLLMYLPPTGELFKLYDYAFFKYLFWALLKL